MKPFIRRAVGIKSSRARIWQEFRSGWSKPLWTVAADGDDNSSCRTIEGYLFVSLSASSKRVAEALVRSRLP